VGVFVSGSPGATTHKNHEKTSVRVCAEDTGIGLACEWQEERGTLQSAVMNILVVGDVLQRPAHGDFPDALAPDSRLAGITVGRLVPLDPSNSPAGSVDCHLHSADRLRNSDNHK